MSSISLVYSALVEFELQTGLNMTLIKEGMDMKEQCAGIDVLYMAADIYFGFAHMSCGIEDKAIVRMVKRAMRDDFVDHLPHCLELGNVNKYTQNVFMAIGANRIQAEEYASQIANAYTKRKPDSQPAPSEVPMPYFLIDIEEML